MAEPTSAAREQIEQAIAAIESQRTLIGDAAADAALQSLREQLAAQVPSLRQAVVLFMDLTGSTELVRALGLEPTQALVDEVLHACRAIVQAHGGRVLQYTGDGLLAVFGAETSREHETERAVSCGLALLREGRRLAAQARAAHGHDTGEMRVGVHVGPVLLGGGIEGTGTIRGITVNIAARMQQSAPPGTLRASAAAWHATRGAFEGEAQAPITVKGIAQPMATWLVRGPRAADAAADLPDVAGVRAPLCGRNAELAALLAAAQAPEGPALWPLMGEAGVGKSRLAAEFEQRHRAAGGRPPLRARALPDSEAQPYGLLRTLVHQVAGTPTHAPWPEVQAAVTAGLQRGHDAETAADHARTLGRLLGHDVGGATPPRASDLRMQAFHAARELLRLHAEAASGRLPLLLDDLHWCDDGSLDFIATLTALPRLLVVLLARPRLQERRPDWPPLQQAPVLAPLAQADSAQLADHLLVHVAEGQVPLRALLVGRAQGNPFFMEELLRMLLDERVLQPIEPAPDGRPRWRVAEDLLARLPVPASLSGLLQARLDRLPPALLRALRQAAVVGPRIEPAWLAAIDADAPACLPALAERDLLVQGRGAHLQFRHQLLQQVAYEGLLKRERQRWHGRLGDHLAAQGNGAYGELPALAASHLERANRPADAGRLYARAARLAQGRATFGEQRRLAERALALPHGADALSRWKLHSLALAACITQGDREGHARHLQGMRGAARETGSPRVIAQTESQSLRDDMGARVTPEQAEAVLRQCEQAEADEAHAPGLPSPLVHALGEWAWALSMAGRQQEAFQAGQRLVAAAGALDLPLEEIAGHNTCAIAAWKSGDLSLGMHHLLQTQDIGRRIGDHVGRMQACFNLASFTRRLGQYERSLQAIEEGRQLALRVSAELYQQALLGRRSQTRLAMGDADAALADAQACPPDSASVFVRELGYRARGQALLALMRPDEALACFQAGVAELGTRTLAVEHTAGIVQAHTQRGDRAALRTAADELALTLATPDEIDGTELPELLLALHDGLQALGDPAASDAWQRAQVALDALAARISDPAVRATFLDRVSGHRRLRHHLPQQRFG